MLSKLGFILVVALFGGLMFVAGAVAPDGVRTPVAAYARKLAAKLPVLGEEPKAPTAAAAPVADEAPPLPSESLMLPTPLPAKGRYALQAGQFAAAEAAAALGRRLQAAGVVFQTLAVVDSSGQKWSLVAAGDYISPDDARTARTALAQAAGLTEALPVILLPEVRK